ncbi:MAG TPA: helix-turn-helix domain-containing protein [Candidatus Saccharibacteria bacterium]|nr:helix-turn-helix domain-containing protein [Candidatus Saccharibacteria bacterium]
MINLSAAGLNPTEAHVYQVLLSKKEWKPADLAKNVGESRTNMYKILDKLTALELAIKFDKSNKIHYRATNPTRLVQLAQEHRAQLEQSQKELETSTQSLLNEFIKTHEQPGVRFFMGKDDIERVYQDQVNDQKPIYFMLSPKAIDFYGYAQMHKLRMLAVKAKIPRFAITPENTRVPSNYEETDKAYLLTRTWLEANDYTASFEWGVYGDKVYFVTFGEDALAMIIESKAMAEGFKQIFSIIDSRQRSKPSYARLPKTYKYT